MEPCKVWGWCHRDLDFILFSIIQVTNSPHEYIACGFCISQMHEKMEKLM
jgi:hypothetical protein